MNVQEYLNSLPDDVKFIDLSDKNLSKLPDLSRFYNLQILYCPHNELTTIPLLPSLKELYCEHNRITIIPVLSLLEILKLIWSVDIM